MPTGACGINCDVCRLKILGICGTCGPARSREAENKMAVQENLLGAPCPVLACAVAKGVQHCTKDCDDFPCNQLKEGLYPFGREFLRMQERRRNQADGHQKGRVRGNVKVPAEYWQSLVNRDVEQVCSRALVPRLDPKGWVVPFLNREILVDRQTRCIFQRHAGQWAFIDNPMVELLCLVYLMNAGPEVLKGEKVGARDLKTGHFFKGPHEINVGPLLARYGKDPEGFGASAEALGGAAISMGNKAYRFMPFPKVPLYYVMWLGDEEFPANLSILFDRSIEYHLKADAILGLVELINHLLIHGAGKIL